MLEKPEDKEKGFEKWMKRLSSEPLKPCEETEKKEQYLTLTRRQLDNMVDSEEMEKEDYQDAKRRELRKRGYKISGTDYQRPKKKYSW